MYFSPISFCHHDDPGFSQRKLHNTVLYGTCMIACCSNSVPNVPKFITPNVLLPVLIANPKRVLTQCERMPGQTEHIQKHISSMQGAIWTPPYFQPKNKKKTCMEVQWQLPIPPEHLSHNSHSQPWTAFLSHSQDL